MNTFEEVNTPKPVKTFEEVILREQSVIDTAIAFFMGVATTEQMKLSAYELLQAHYRHTTEAIHGSFNE